MKIFLIGLTALLLYSCTLAFNMAQSDGEAKDMIKEDLKPSLDLDLKMEDIPL